MLFMSTLATYGRGVGIAVSTGMNTQIGKIAKMLDEKVDDETPLQKKLAAAWKVPRNRCSIHMCSYVYSWCSSKERSL